MVSIEHCSEFDEILKQTNLDEFELVHSPEHHDMSEVLLDIVSAPAIDVNNVSRMACHEGIRSSGILRLGEDSCQGSYPSILNINFVHEFCM